MGAILTVADVRHWRGRREILRVDRLEVAAGERLGVLGLNGAGKTTLLRLLAGIDQPSVGEVRIGDVPTSRGGPALRRRLAYAPQRPVLLSTTVRHNVELPLRYRRVPRAGRRVAATEALARLGVEHLADRPAHALSGGEAQRVSLARALACAPDALLLDEPAAGLDTPSRAAFFADVERALADRATTVVLVSHRAEEVLALADRVAVLVAGQLRQAAPGDDLVTHPADVDVARLVGYENIIDVHIDDDGNVRAGERPTGLTAPPGARAASLAIWATAIHVRNARDSGLPATVERVTTGPGRHELTLNAGLGLRAHLPLTTPPPQIGTRVSLQLDPSLAVLLDPPFRSRSDPGQNRCKPQETYQRVEWDGDGFRRVGTRLGTRKST
jgi:ABC-type sulfate/molybdate transport systems ATPase subunit